MSPEVLGLYLLAGLFVLILFGFPISFTLIFAAVAAGYLGIGMGVFEMMVVQFERTMELSTLAAVPLFIFMGLILERAALMERLFGRPQGGCLRSRAVGQDGHRDSRIELKHGSVEQRLVAKIVHDNGDPRRLIGMRLDRDQSQAKDRPNP